MLRCLNQDQPDGTLSADVIVIGAGLAGLILADKLGKLGWRAVVVESGGETQATDVHPLNHVEMLGAPYSGAAHGRFRCLGGTSTRWGGALLPYVAADLIAHPCGWHDGWGAAATELPRYLPEVEKTFGVGEGSYEGEQGVPSAMTFFVPRMPKWPSFRNRSTANLFRKEILTAAQLQVWINATVTAIRTDCSRVRGVTARSPSGKQLSVEAPHVVIAAGAIEATRLLLLFNRTKEGRVFGPASPLGRGFHDHLSASVAKLDVIDSKALARLFGFRFVRGGMRNLRFELGQSIRKQQRLPGAFLHVAFCRTGVGGFEGLRELYQAVQRRELPRPSSVKQIAADAPWLARALWWRAVEQRVLAPTRSSFELHLVTEQEPSRNNEIGLSQNSQDLFGQPLATVSWSISARDLAAFFQIADLAIEDWGRSELTKIAQLAPLERSVVIDELYLGGGIYHPAGTTRIGPNASEGVVDDRLRVYGVPGLRVLATSVYPSIGGSSPSLALAQLAYRMADDISGDFSLAS